MDQFIGENVDNVLQRVDLLFSEKVVPLITKVIEEQKQKITSDIVAQIENSFIKKLNGEDVMDSKIDEPYFIQVDGNRKKGSYYDYKLNPKYSDYNYAELKKITEEIFLKIKEEKDSPHWQQAYSYRGMNQVHKFIEQLHKGEYLICVYMDFSYLCFGSYTVYLITNFGSIFCDNDYYINNNNQCPKSILDIFIESVIPNSYNGHKIHTSRFNELVIGFQKWWQSRPLVGYTAELLKQENEKLKEEHQKIKHMYETLELKDQYHKAVELLKQNKKEREVLDQDRREFYREREESRREIEEKTKRYRQIQDIDTEITRLALIKQKLEKDRKDFEEEKAKFEEIRNSLM